MMATHATAGHKRWLLPVALIALVVGLVAVALLRGPVVLDPDSPEGTVQEYLLAMSEARWEDALAVIHPDWAGSCEPEDLSAFAPTDFSAQLGQAGGFGGGVGGGFAEPPIDVGGDPLPIGEETIEVTITRDEGSGLGGGWNEFVLFELADVDDFWWIVNDPWPYFIWNCRG